MHTRIVVLAALALAGIAQAESLPRGGRIAWQYDLQACLREAKETSRPLMLYFTHDL